MKDRMKKESIQFHRRVVHEEKKDIVIKSIKTINTYFKNFVVGKVDELEESDI
jgi:hypothetical protein